MYYISHNQKWTINYDQQAQLELSVILLKTLILCQVIQSVSFSVNPSST